MYPFFFVNFQLFDQAIHQEWTRKEFRNLTTMCNCSDSLMITSVKIKLHYLIAPLSNMLRIQIG